MSACAGTLRAPRHLPAAQWKVQYAHGTDYPGYSPVRVHAMSPAGPPQAPVSIPAAIRNLAAGDAVEPVWRNELGGSTFRLRGNRGTRYLKWQDYSGLDSVHRGHVDLRAEAETLKWAGQFSPVPQVLEFAEHQAGFSRGEAASSSESSATMRQGEPSDAAWLITAGVEAESAFHPRWHQEPETAVRAIAAGLRRLHDALPVESCPFEGGWSASQGAELPSPEKLVVCHGDPCVPNTLISAEGRFAAHVDLGQLGVADRWSDLAIASYSISWEINFGRNYDELFFSTYGVEPDQDRITFYRQLWDADG